MPPEYCVIYSHASYTLGNIKENEVNIRTVVNNHQLVLTLIDEMIVMKAKSELN
jgi:hypothetical protein